MALLSVKNLSVVYRTAEREVSAVRGASFDVEAGEFVSIVGGSGSGKSTVASAVARLTDYLPCRATGQVLFGGTDIFAASDTELRRIRREGIAYVFQDPSSSLNPVMRVGDQIAEAMRRPSKEGVTALLESVRIRDASRVAASFPHQLSGGMKQRAVIAMALAKEPSLLVADEPTTALDSVVQKEILSLFLELKKNRGLSVFFITHDLNVARAVSGRVLVMQEGQIVDTGEASTGFRFKHPYAVKLLGAASAGERPKTPLNV